DLDGVALDGGVGRRGDAGDGADDVVADGAGVGRPATGVAGARDLGEVGLAVPAGRGDDAEETGVDVGGGVVALRHGARDLGGLQLPVGQGKGSGVRRGVHRVLELLLGRDVAGD